LKSGGLARRDSAVRVIGAVALAKSCVGALGLLVEPQRVESTIPATVYLLVLSVFLVAGSGLVLGGRRDRRAIDLGVVFLVVASTFADRGLGTLGTTLPGGGWALLLGRHVCLEALSPWLLWSFVGRFPAGSLYGRPADLWRTAMGATFIVGMVLVFVQLGALLVPSGATPPRLLDSLSRHGAGTLYWGILFGLQALAIVFATWRSLHVRVEERRRVRLLLAGLLSGSAPITVVAVLGVVSPTFEAWVTSPGTVRSLGFVIYPGLLLIPLAAWYAVVVDQALDVRLVVRLALQYALARGTALLAIGLPSVLLGLLVFTRRDESLTSLLRGPGASFALLLVVVALLAIRSRGIVLNAIDRVFFREQYDARVTLGTLINATQHITDPSRLSTLVVRELDRALHIVQSHVMVRDEASGLLIAASSGVRPISADGHLGRSLEAHTGVVTVGWSDPDAWNRRLPESEASWLADTGARLILALRGHDGACIGLLTVGDKQSELPFSKEDQELIEAIGAAMALALDRWLMSVTPGPTARAGHVPELAGHAWECPMCGRVSDSEGVCGECGTDSLPSPIQFLVGGQYRLERRIGMGGMGVVYRAVDVELARTVAVKTLPRVGLEHTQLLRREARAVAALSHPVLAAIFDYETWKGVPILIFEYLEGGTLADRLGDARLTLGEGLQLGVELASGLEAMHADGVLHRDVKPSNVGFTRRGAPKLLDLGIAVVIGLSEDESTQAASWAGTPAYMSPEAIDGFPPTPAVDVWGLVVTIYEAIAGRHPFAAPTRLGTVARIGWGTPPDLRADLPDAPVALVDFFGVALSRHAAGRPTTAPEVKVRLTALAEALRA